MPTQDEPAFEVEPRWKEQVFYREAGEEFLFDGGWGVTPPSLYVPSERDWDAATPAWMHGRRTEIVERLADATGHRIVVGPYPVIARTEPAQGSPAQPSAEYWRRTFDGVAAPRYYKLVGGDDFLLRDGAWVPFPNYKSGPSWWRLTGETGVDRIEATELPPGTPL